MSGIWSLHAAVAGERELRIARCKSAEKDAKAEAEKIEAALALMKHPMQFAYHVGHDLLLNRVDIFHEVDAAVTAYKAAQYAGNRRMEAAAFHPKQNDCTLSTLSHSRLSPATFCALGGRCSARTSVRH